jgi:antitoxin VapB
MLATAKVFATGNSQAIRLPKAFRLDSEEVWISKSTDGILTIQPKPKKDELEAFLAELRSMPMTEEFLQPRDDAPRPSPFEDWEA